MIRRSRHVVRFIGRYFAIPALILLAVRLIWGYESSHRLAAMLTSIRAQGLPLYPTDYPDETAIPAAENAIPDLLDALKTFNPGEAERELISPSDAAQPLAILSRTPADIDALETLWKSNESLGDLLDDLFRRPKAIVPRSVIAESLDYSGGLPASFSYAKCRTLANLLVDKAAIAHTNHNDAETLHDLRRILTLAHLVDQNPPIIATLVGTAIQSLAVNSFDELEPTLDLRDPAAAAEALLLLHDLVSDDFATAPLERGLGGEIVGNLINYPTYYPKKTWWFRPLYEDELVRVLQWNLTVLHAAQARNWQQTHLLYPHPPVDNDLSNLDSVVCNIEGQLTSVLDRVILLYTRSLSDTRAASLLLAARLYAARHGTLPQNAANLVPELLDHLPEDPFSASSEPMHYRLDPDGPTVWSVSENGTNENAPILFDAAGNEVRRFGGSLDPAKNPPDLVYGAAWRTAKPPPTLPANRPATAPE